MRCSLCGDRKRLNEFGVCEYRPNCEHRIMVADALVTRLMATPEYVGCRYIRWMENGIQYLGVEHLYSDGSSHREVHDSWCSN